MYKSFCPTWPKLLIKNEWINVIILFMFVHELLHNYAVFKVIEKLMVSFCVLHVLLNNLSILF